MLYTYDVNGNATSMRTHLSTINYSYDGLNQLIKEILLDGTQIDYTYDAVGNRKQKIVTPMWGGSYLDVYNYDDANRLISVGTQQYTYDVNGNLTNNGNKIFVYDEVNQLKQVKDINGNIISLFSYDDKGRRTSMTVSNITTYFHYRNDINKIVYETDINNNMIADYTWDANGNPITFTKGGNTYYYHLNAHGDVMGLTDIAGNIVATYEYDAWGNIVGQLGTMAAANPYRYSGYQYDEYTGLYYLMTRYYDPNTGRFITADDPMAIKSVVDDAINNPTGLKGELTLLSNPYVYCANNPINYTDATGTIWKISQPWNSVNNVAFTIDVAIFAISVVSGAVGFAGQTREILRRNSKGVIMKLTTTALKKVKLAKSIFIVSSIINGLKLFLDLSFGMAIARVRDRHDIHKNNGILDKFY